MKNTGFSILLIWFAIFGLALNTFAQDSPQWHLPEGAKTRLGKGGISEIAYSPDGTRLAVASSIGIWIYDAQTGEALDLLTGHTWDVTSVAFSPDGQTLASGSYDATIRLWDANTGRNIHTLTGHTDWVRSVAFAPDGQTLASGSDDTIRLWDAHTGRNIRTLTGHTANVSSVAFSPDANTIASGSSDDTIRLWDANTGRHLRTLTGHTNWVESIAFSPDANTIASGSWDQTLRLWDANTGRHLRTLTGHTSWVRSVAFSPHANTIASGSSDGTVLLWELVPSATSNATLSLSPSPAQSPAIGKQLTLSLTITDGKNVAGYQASVSYDPSALRYVRSTTGNYLPEGAFFVPPVVVGNTVTLAATALAGESKGNGTLATVTFEVVGVKASSVRLYNVLLTDSAGVSSRPRVEAMQITVPPQLAEDINKDGIVNIQDLVLVASNFGQTGENAADVNADGVVNVVDLTLVAGAIGSGAGAPSAWGRSLEFMPTREQVQQWLHQARQMNLTTPAYQRGILMLEQLLVMLTPKETALLPNYPNPFNPETWIPYQLAEPAEVTVSIYAADGRLVRTLALGHQPVDMYQSRGHAAYWDGRNALGEPVASGVYFYTLTADHFTATRKMLIRK